MRIALTGATGFIGSHLLPKLIELGHTVDTNLWKFRYNQYDLCIHLAAVTHIRSDFDGKLFDTNIVMAEEIFRMPCRIIYASSCSAKFMTNPYAYTKRYAEYLGERHGNALGLRFHNCYGPGNNKGIVKYLMDKKDGETVNIRGPELVRDYIHVDDVVAYIIEMSKDHPIWFPGGEEKKIWKVPRYFNGVADVGTGLGVETMDLVNLFMKVSGKRFFINVSEPGENEPKSMVSEVAVPSMDLVEGLLKTIQSETRL